MKLRIRENSVRLRLTKSEVAQFAETGLVESRTDFRGRQVFVYALKKDTAADTLRADFTDGRLEINVPQELADGWTNTAEVGIEGLDDKVKVMIEKDFACLTGRTDEDESDAFPHPREKDQNC